LALLEPVLRKLVRQIISDAAADGSKLMVFETYRSQAQCSVYLRTAPPSWRPLEFIATA
jgi:hypothetical protein